MCARVGYNTLMQSRTQSNWLCDVTYRLTFVLGAVCVCIPAMPVCQAVGISVTPTSIVLTAPEASQQVLVTRNVADRAVDLTRQATYESADGSIALVSANGRVRPVGAGTTEIRISDGLDTVRVVVDTRGIADPSLVSFHADILPILSKAGCNSAGCHGKAEGQNGFKLSVFGFDPVADHRALVREGRGRRVLVTAPAHSLLLRKASGDAPHGGGVKVEPGGRWYRQIARWIAEGAHYEGESAAAIQHIVAEPRDIVMAIGDTQQLRVMATDLAGETRCVTAEAEFYSNMEDVAAVDPDGLIAVTGVPGEAAILVRYRGHVAVTRVMLPQADVEFPRPPENNFIDRLVWDKLQQLGIRPSDLADDATYLRRIYLDVTGRLPTVEDVRHFLDDPATDKRARLVDELLDRDEYVDYQVLRWSDILRVDKSELTPQGAVAMTRWLRQQFQQNTPYDQFARQVVVAQGNVFEEGPAGFYQVHADGKSMARAISQVFLGVRIECAQCHHHPFEKWGERDYFAFAGFFSGVRGANGPTGGHKIVSRGGAALKHPRTDEEVATAALGAPPATFADMDDRRQVLADWMTAPDNPFFARMIANRTWAHYFARGLVEPLDDLRDTNPASNEPLLGALAQHLVAADFDVKSLTRTILNSRVYQLSSASNASNQLDGQNFSHAAWKTVPAEVLLDAISQVTDVSADFDGWPRGYRAMRIWDNLMPSYFFRVFGRPARVSVCECERGSEPTMAQALHLMNSPELMLQISHRDGLTRRLSDSDRSADEIVDLLYLTAVSRFPSDQEKNLMRQAFQESIDRRTATEDIMWTLLNTREFVYNH